MWGDLRKTILEAIEPPAQEKSEVGVARRQDNLGRALVLAPAGVRRGEPLLLPLGQRERKRIPVFLVDRLSPAYGAARS